MQSNAEKVWAIARENLRVPLNPEVFQLWFAPLRAVTMDAESFTIEVSDDFREMWLKDNYHDLLRDVIATATGKRLEVRFQVAAHTAHPATPAPAAPKVKAPVEAPARAHAQGASEAEPSFNPRNTFETFVVGNNQFAHSAALAVAQAPGKSYNPLFLYGGVGLGKTHLLHAIGHHVSAHKKGARVAYVTTEKFTNEFIAGLQENALAKFRKKYRQTDLLLIDDVQFLAGKERIQEEFFHTFNALHEAHKQIVLTCDRPASEIQGLEQRLVSRFEWGLIADIQSPDLETRVAILKRKAEAEAVPLPDPVAMYIASRIKSNIRELEGSLIRLIAYASLTGREISLDLTKEVLRNVIEQDVNVVTIETIQKFVSDYYQLRVSELKSRNNSKSVATPRQIAMYLCKALTSASLPEIGRSFGGKHHSTVIHSIRKVEERRQADADFNNLISSFLTSFR